MINDDNDDDYDNSLCGFFLVGGQQYVCAFILFS